MLNNNEILYGLHDKPKVLHCISAALQHVMACFIGFMTPTLIIGTTLGLTQEIPYLISMALMVSSVATFIQPKIGTIGSGLIPLQGTSFTFISALLVAGLMVKEKGSSND